VWPIESEAGTDKLTNAAEILAKLVIRGMSTLMDGGTLLAHVFPRVGLNVCA